MLKKFIGFIYNPINTANHSYSIVTNYAADSKQKSHFLV